jgi:hypothetical protein
MHKGKRVTVQGKKYGFPLWERGRPARIMRYFSHFSIFLCGRDARAPRKKHLNYLPVNGYGKRFMHGTQPVGKIDPDCPSFSVFVFARN